MFAPQRGHGGAKSFHSVGRARHGGARPEVDVESGIAIPYQAPLGWRPDQLGLPVLAGGDAGTPVALDDDQPLAAEFARIAAALVDNPPDVVAMDGCSARMLERVEAAVAAGDAG